MLRDNLNLVLRYFRLIDARLYSAVLTLWAIIYDWFSRNFAIREWTRLTSESIFHTTRQIPVAVSIRQQIGIFV